MLEFYKLSQLKVYESIVLEVNRDMLSYDGF